MLISYVKNINNINHIPNGVKAFVSYINKGPTFFQDSKKHTSKQGTRPFLKTEMRSWQRCKTVWKQNDYQTYTLLSHNILAQDLLTEHLHLYLHAPPNILKWEHRMRLLKLEIQNLQPDILCLQEIQFNHLKNFVSEIAQNRKLEYVFKKTTGTRSDGCAIIYNKEKFKLLEDQFVEYYTPGLHLLNRNNIAVMAKFNVIGNPNNNVVIATTHLLYNPKRNDVRIAQISVLYNALNQFCQNENGQLLPIILTGDFNTIPQSPPHQLLTVPFQTMDRPLRMRIIDFGNDSASTFQNEWIQVDYILHSLGRNRKLIKIWDTYRLPSIDNCYKMGKIPNDYVGSDHYPLAIKFSIH